MAHMLAQAPDAAFALDLEGRFLPAANQRFEEGTGYSISELAGKHYSTLLPDREVSRSAALFRKAVRGELLEFVEVEIVTRSGASMWVELSVAPLERGGQAVGVVCMGRNATQRMRDLIDVVRLERLHEAIVNAVGAGIVLVTSELRVSAWNTYMQKWLGLRRDEVVGKHVSDLFPGLCAEGLENRIRAALATGEPYRLERWRHESHYERGATRYVDVSVQAVDDAQGGERRVLIVFDDVTDRVALEQERVSSERLRAVAETAAKANHEINNPLAALLGNVELLQRSRGLDDTCQRRLGRIIESVDRVVDVVRGLADMAKPAVTEEADLWDVIPSRDPRRPATRLGGGL